MHLASLNFYREVLILKFFIRGSARICEVRESAGFLLDIQVECQSTNEPGDEARLDKFVEDEVTSSFVYTGCDKSIGSKRSVYQTLC